LKYKFSSEGDLRQTELPLPGTFVKQGRLIVLNTPIATLPRLLRTTQFLRGIENRNVFVI
jgi:hypothetical protein